MANGHCPVRDATFSDAITCPICNPGGDRNCRRGYSDVEPRAHIEALCYGNDCADRNTKPAPVATSVRASDEPFRYPAQPADLRFRWRALIDALVLGFRMPGLPAEFCSLFSW